MSGCVLCAAFLIISHTVEKSKKSTLLAKICAFISPIKPFKNKPFLELINSNNALTPSCAQPLSQNSTDGEDQDATPNIRPNLETSKTINNKAYKKAKLKEYENWYLEELPNYIEGHNFDRDRFEKAIAKKLENEFGNNWWHLEDQNLVDLASSVENRLMKDLDYFVNEAWPNALKEDEENNSTTKDSTIINDDSANENVEVPDAQINQSLTAETSTKIDDDIEEDLPF